MDLKDFNDSLANKTPPKNLSLALQALWHDAQGDWNTAHRLAQSDNGRNAAWVHAYLHRKEGDTWNAGYWYSRADRPVEHAALEDEWEKITQALLVTPIKADN